MWFLIPILAGLIGMAAGVLLLLVGEKLAKAGGAGPTLSFVLSVIAIWAIGRIAIHSITWMPDSYWRTTEGARVNLLLFSLSGAYIFALLFGAVRLIASRLFGS